ncbi:1194_t:CDS:1, partial [Acaulospora colombiana]
MLIHNRYNEIEELPNKLASLPHLSTLNISHNKLTQIPLIIQAESMSRARSESFFSATVERAKVTLPSLRVLQASHNQLRSDTFPPQHLPKELLELDISNNPLGPAKPLLTALEGLERLKILRMASCDLIDDGFPTKMGKFPALQLLDLGDNEKLSEDKVADAMGDREFEIGPTNTNSTVKLHVIAGKPGPVKEAWEIEAENRARTRKVSSKLGAAATTTPASPRTNTGRGSVVSPTPARVEEPQKEQWEIEAEQGLLTEAGRRRARAAAATSSSATTTQASTSKPSLATEMSNMSISATPGVPSLVQFYDGPHATLTLPQSQPQSRTHN